MFRNWAHNHASQPSERVSLTDTDDVVRLVKRALNAKRSVRAVGAGHSWSDIACTSGILVDLDPMRRYVHVDPVTRRVRVQAGARLKQLNEDLEGFGLGISVLGSVAEQSIAGATSTGTHGSGLGFGNVATSIRAMQLVNGLGDVVDVREGDPLLNATALALGALGIITELELQVEPAFNLEERRWSLPFEQALSQMDRIVAEHEHVKFWWLPHTNDVAVFAANRTEKPRTPPSRLARKLDEVANDHVFWQVLQAGRRQPRLIPALNKTLNKVYFQPGSHVDRSDRIFNLAMPPRHLEIEYGIPVAHAAEMLSRTRDLIDRQKLRVNFIQEVRFVAADTLWLSNSYERATCQFGAYTGFNSDAQKYFDGVHAIAARFDGRPHWGKSFDQRGHELRELYPRWDDFAQTRNAFDPHGIFANSFVRRLFDVAI